MANLTKVLFQNHSNHRNAGAGNTDPNSTDILSQCLASKGVRSALLITTLIYTGCSNESTGDAEDFVIEEACVEFTPSNAIQTVFTNDPITTADSLSAGISFDYAQRISGAVPNPVSAGNLVFSDVVVTDKTVQSLFVSGDVPDGSRIGAVIVGIAGVNEYFAIPVESSQGTGATSGLPIEVTLRGPFPVPGTTPEPDIIQSQLINNLIVTAILVDENAAAPDLSGDITALLADSNQLLSPPVTPTITAENVGTGGIQVTLFWNQPNDIDLWLIEPDTNRIYYLEPSSVAGDGFLDFDNVTGFGPENIFFSNNIPEGNYQVQVNYFAGSEPTNWSVSISACGSTGSFSGRLEASGEVDNVFSFDYAEGCTIEFPTQPDTRSRATTFDQAVICESQP